MANLKASPFSQELQTKIDYLKAKRTAIKLGSIHFDSPLLLAPMSAICNRPFRLLMEDLGAGGTVSELISCHGINYGNHRTLDMLKLDPAEKNVGLQLFGEDAKAMAKAAATAQEYNPKFIDINMGCPVRKVVTKGGGSALMKDTSALAPFFREIKKAIEIPLTIKIRMGWDEDQVNADEIMRIALGEGIEFVGVHGRTRVQQYRGEANWNYLESIASLGIIPMIGNGDLHQTHQVVERMKYTRCQALMLGRGPLRNPFIFLESLIAENEDITFTPADYLEVINRYREYCEQAFDRERTILVQLKKMIVWFCQGFPRTAKFRNEIFESKSLEEVIEKSQTYFSSIQNSSKHIDFGQSFMAGGHG